MKISFLEAASKLKDKKIVLHAPMYGKPLKMVAAVCSTSIGLGWVSLDAGDTFTFRDGDTIGFKSLDDGNGYIRIQP